MRSATRRVLAPLASAWAAAAAAGAQTTTQLSFTNYFAVGDSLTAGYTNASLVETHQAQSVPALIARQAGVGDFQQPLVAEPGIPAELALLSLTPGPSIVPKATSPGAPKNAGLARPYNNMGVPGATTLDVLNRTGDGGGFHDLVLRGRGTQVAQVAGSRPTVVTLWVGNADVLGAAVRGQAIDGVTLTPTAVFRAAYGAIVAALKASGATIVAANLPDVTAIPFVTTIKPYVVDPATGAPVLAGGNPVPLIGPNGPLPPGTFVTLAARPHLARGVGIPTALGGAGTALPEDVILDASEVASIRDHVARNNEAIHEICGQNNVFVLDVHTLLDELSRRGRRVGGITLTASYLTGGFYGYDGVHPTPLGYAMLANEWILAINAAGGALPELDLRPFLGIGVAGASAQAASTAAAAAEFTAEAYENLLLAFPRVDGK